MPVDIFINEYDGDGLERYAKDDIVEVLFASGIILGRNNSPWPVIRVTDIDEPDLVYLKKDWKEKDNPAPDEVNPKSLFRREFKLDLDKMKAEDRTVYDTYRFLQMTTQEFKKLVYNKKTKKYEA